MRTLTRSWLPFALGMVVVLVFVNLAGSQQRPRRQYIGPSNPDGQRAFSSAVLVGDTLYLSGRIAAATKGRGRPKWRSRFEVSSTALSAFSRKRE